MASFITLHPRVTNNIQNIDTLVNLLLIPDPQLGDVLFVVDQDEAYIYESGGWEILAGSGVIGPNPGVTTNNAVARWDGTDGSQLKNSTVVISDAGVTTGISIDADGSGNSITNLENENIKASAAIDAAKIHDGSVSNTEFGYLGAVTSDIQTQLNTGATNLSNHINDTTDAHAASAITNTPSGNLAATDVQGALNELQSDVDLRELASNKGIADGYASLDSGGKIPAAQLPNSIMDYLGTWAASTNTPTLANGSGSAGDVYIASDAGTVDFGAGGITFAAGDWVVYSGSIWEKSINSNAVASVNGFTGAVVLDYDDVNAISEMGAVTDNRLVRTHGSTGDLIQESGITISDGDAVTGVTALTVDNLSVDGNTVSATSGDLNLGAGANSILATGAYLQLRAGMDLALFDNDNSNSIVITSPTNIGTNRTPALIDDTGDFVLTSATQALTNKTIDGNSNTLTVLAGTQLSGATPIANGGTGQTTATAAFDALSPMTARGDLIRGGVSGAAETFVAVTDNRVVRGDGTDVVSGQIDDPAFFTSGSAATTSAYGTVTASYQELDISSSGNFSAAQPVLRISRINQLVTLTWASLAHSSLAAPASATAFIPAEYRPVSTTANLYSSYSGGSRMIFIEANGQISFQYRDWAGTGLALSSTDYGSISWVIDA